MPFHAYLTAAGPSSAVCRTADGACCRERLHQGFKECQEETLHYFVEGEAMGASDPFCMRVMEHLSTIAQRFGPCKLACKPKFQNQFFKGNYTVV